MKKMLPPLLLLLSTFAIRAQEIPVPAPKPYKHELGIFTQIDMGGNEHLSMGLTGLQYRYRHTERLGIRAIAAYGSYSSSGSETFHGSGDTIITHQKHFDIGLPVLGLGLEAKRHFYRKVYLFAALELKGGYGAGSGGTLERRSTGHGDSITYHLSQNIDRRDASLLYIGMTASVGGQIQWSRVCLGLELLPVTMMYRKIDDDTGRAGIADLNLGDFSQRLFLHYRF